MKYLPSIIFGLSFFVTALTFTNADFALPMLAESFMLAIQAGLIVYLLPKVNIARFELVLWMGGAALLFLLALRSGLSLQSHYFPGSRNCMLMPSVIPKLECFYMQTFAQHHGLRQFFFHIVAFTTAFTSSLVLRSAADSPRSFMAASLSVWLFPLIAAFFVIAENFGLVSDAVVGKAFIASTFPTGTGRVISSNPGWLWPFFGPCIALTIAFQWNKTTPFWARCGAATLTIACLYAALVSRQRGAYLMAGTAVTVWALLPLLQKERGRKFWLWSALIAVSLAASYLVIIHFQLLPQLLEFVRIPASKEPISASHERLVIWAEAWRQLRADSVHLFLGSGHSTWFQSFSQHAAGEPLSLTFSTAHNFFVQSIYELGLLHMALIFGWFGVVGFVLVRIPASRPGAIALGLIALPALLVQEVDHVSTVYLQYALAAGAVVAAAVSKPATLAQQAPTFVPPNRSSSSLAMVTGILSLLAVIGLATQLSWGGMGFEPYIAHGYQFTRKFRTSGSIAFHSNRSSAPYTLVEFVSRAGPINSSCSDLAFESSQKWRIVQSGGRFAGRSCPYSVEQKFDDLQMSYSFEVLLPMYQTRVPIVDATGAWTMNKNADSRTATWHCSGSCSATFPRCSNAAQVQVLGPSGSADWLAIAKLDDGSARDRGNFQDVEIVDYRCAD